MECEVIIPYGNNGDLGAAYNRAMERAKDWVCFFDHDILQVNPNWYKIITDAIEKIGRGAGFLTATCNAIACSEQLRKEAPAGHDIIDHMNFAKRVQQKYGTTPAQIDPRKMQIPFSGFMIATHKGAWRAAGGFKSGFLGVDNHYHIAIANAGYSSWILPGLYMYHIYHAKMKWPIQNKLPDLFSMLANQPSDINEHLQTLREYASKCQHITEFGFRTGVSTVALLSGEPKRLVTYDIDPECEKVYQSLRPYVEKTDFTFKMEDTAKSEIEETDFLFIDSAHTYFQCRSELAQSGNKAKKFIGFHDTATFGEIGENKKKPGLLSAINEFIKENPHWKVVVDNKNNNGLIVLERS